MQQRLGLQRVPHAGRLFRTRAACPVHGRGRPDSEQQAHVRMRRPRLHIAGLRALQRAWCRAAPLLSHAGRLFRTRDACPVHGRGCPGSEQQAHVRMRRPRLHIASLRALRRAWCRAVPLLSHAGRLFRTRAACPVRGRGCPDSEQQAHVRMRRPHQGTQSTNPSNTTRPITPHVNLLGWKAPLDLLDLRGLREPAGHQIDRFELQARGTLTVGRTAPGSRARQCRCVQPSHRPPSYHPAQPGAGALGPRRRGGQSRGSRATGG